MDYWWKHHGWLLYLRVQTDYYDDGAMFTPQRLQSYMGMQLSEQGAGVSIIHAELLRELSLSLLSFSHIHCKGAEIWHQWGVANCAPLWSTVNTVASLLRWPSSDKTEEEEPTHHYCSWNISKFSAFKMLGSNIFTWIHHRSVNVWNMCICAAY